MNWRASPSVVALWLKGRGAHSWGPLSEWLRGGTGKLPEGAEAVNALRPRPRAVRVYARYRYRCLYSMHHGGSSQS